MRPALIALPCLLAVTGVQSSAANGSSDGAILAATTYSSALMAADCEGMQALSAVIHRHPEARDVFRKAAADWKQQGLHERLRLPTARLASGRYRMVVIPITRFMVMNGRPSTTDGAYVVASDDGGRHWQVLDLAAGCPHLEDWIKDLYPPYDGHPSFDEASLAASR